MDSRLRGNDVVGGEGQRPSPKSRHRPSDCRHIFARPGNQMPRLRFVSHCLRYNTRKGTPMNSIIYLVGLVVIVMAVLSFVGLH
jgi:hypothetical protein